MFIVDPSVCGNFAFFLNIYSSINDPGLNIVSNIRSTYMRTIKPVDKIVLDNPPFLKDKFSLNPY